MPFHEMATQRLREIGVNNEKILEINDVAAQVTHALSTCDLEGTLIAYLNANEELETVLSKDSEGGKKDILSAPHRNAFAVYAQLQNALFRETIQGIRACTGAAAPAAPTVAVPFPETAQELKPKVPRKLSAYNQFIKECASSPEKGGQGKDFKQCAAEWKERRGRS